MKKTTFFMAVFFTLSGALSELFAQETEKTQDRTLNIINYNGPMEFRNPLFNQIFENHSEQGADYLFIFRPFFKITNYAGQIEKVELCRLILDKFDYAVIECRKYYSRNVNNFMQGNIRNSSTSFGEKNIYLLYSSQAKYAKNCIMEVAEGPDFNYFSQYHPDKEIPVDEFGPLLCPIKWENDKKLSDFYNEMKETIKSF